MPRGRHIASALHRHLPQDARAQVRVDEIRIQPSKVPSGGTAPLSFVLHNTAGRSQDLLVDLTTRRHFPGVRRVEALVNGQAIPIGSFTLAG